jgi:hypothetical protein
MHVPQPQAVLHRQRLIEAELVQKLRSSTRGVAPKLASPAACGLIATFRMVMTLSGLPGVAIDPM